MKHAQNFKIFNIKHEVKLLAHIAIKKKCLNMLKEQEQRGQVSSVDGWICLE